MELAKSCDYAIRGLLHLAQRPNPLEPVLLREIAASANAPEAFLSKVFQSLRASGLVRSHRGRRRGYALARAPQEISLYDIVLAMEGPAALRSLHGEAMAPGGHSAFQSVWDQIEDQVAQTMKSTTLLTLLGDIKGKA
jgi:Rrf2 family protein